MAYEASVERGGREGGVASRAQLHLLAPARKREHRREEVEPCVERRHGVALVVAREEVVGVVEELMRARRVEEAGLVAVQARLMDTARGSR